jgi:hypothetical protein
MIVAAVGPVDDVILRHLIKGRSMAVIDHKETPPVRERSMLQHFTRSAIGAVLAALAGLAAVLAVGSLAWSAERGLNGVVIAAIIGALMVGYFEALSNGLLAPSPEDYAGRLVGISPWSPQKEVSQVARSG